MPELLTYKGWVLDVGCRGFKFARCLAQGGCRVIAVDPNKTIEDPGIPGVYFLRKALVVKGGPELPYASWGNGDGNRIVEVSKCPPEAEVYKVPTITLAEVQSQFGIEEFDLIKIDAEGLEYDFLFSLRPPVVKQISVEFHDFLGLNPYPDPELYYEELKYRWANCYEFTKHKKTPMRPDNPIMNYWDSLFVRTVSKVAA